MRVLVLACACANVAMRALVLVLCSGIRNRLNAYRSVAAVA
jgi:hypothetical protein